MRYGLSNGYEFHIVRLRDRDDGSVQMSARLVDPRGNIIIETTGESPCDYPTRKASAGFILSVMLDDKKTQEYLRNDYAPIRARVQEMMGDECHAKSMTNVTTARVEAAVE